MFTKHPKGLIGASLANLGERFGFYIMMAILSLFISAKFGFDELTAGYIFSAFYASIYLLALVGGIIADKTKKYKTTITAGLITMAVGYLLIGYPTPTVVDNSTPYLIITCLGLFVIAFGNGLFKGNLQALVGKMYDNSQYSSVREAGFQIFYMFINIGAIFAPFIAVAIRNYWLKVHNFEYNAALPELCHLYLKGGNAISEQQLANLEKLQGEVLLNGQTFDSTRAFVESYLEVFNTGFQYAFMAAIVMVIISLTIFVMNKSKFPDPATKVSESGKTVTAEEIKMGADEIRQRIYALFAVFGVVIFFWVSFHQNGYSLTFFARDYVDLSVINIDLGFTTIKGAEIFQSVNPFFVVTLTPFVMLLFSYLKKKGRDFSTPMKIALGMGIASLAYVYLMVVSFTLPDKETLSTMDEAAKEAMRVSPMVMIILYLILTIAELFISPLGISFVSKVAPPHLQGLMQGGWLAATAAGNGIIFIGGILYKNVSLSMCWAVFVGATALSMFIMLAMLKWLEKVSK